MKVLLTGGGTGGHLIPLLAVVSELKKLSKEKETARPEFLLLTSDSEFNENISDAGIQIKTIKAGKLRRYFSWKNFADIFKIPIGIIQSLYYIYKFKPDVVFSKGGFTSIPPVVAAWILRIPIITHESDIIPGLANKIIARLSSKILISFSAAEKYFNKNEIILTGNPVRDDITKGKKENALKFFDLSSDLPTILIFGGSQGAQKINEMVLKILPDLIERCQVIHQCGTKNYDKIKSEIKNLSPRRNLSAEPACRTGRDCDEQTRDPLQSLPVRQAGSAERLQRGGSEGILKIKNTVDNLNLENPERYKLYSYLDKKMKDAYAIADIVVSRAGANSISEIAVLGKPNILIPLSTSAANHQFKNAEFFVKKGASLLINETVSSSDDLLNCILKILSDKNLRDEMKNALQDLSPQDSARRIAKEIMKING